MGPELGFHTRYLHAVPFLALLILQGELLICDLNRRMEDFCSLQDHFVLGIKFSGIRGYTIQLFNLQCPKLFCEGEIAQRFT